MRAALIQMTSSDQPDENLAQATALIEAAAAEGAGFVLTPEVTNCVSGSRAHQHEVLRTEDADPVLAGLRDLSAKHGLWTLIGSLALKTDDPDGRFANRSFLVGPDGGIVARYDKIHMFDVQITETETYRESAGFRPGDRAVLAETPFGTVGLTVCYDVRFPHLYRALAQAGAEILTVPAAFSTATGPGHWQTLLQARAIECGAYVLAPAQTGVHPTSTDKRRATHGHSLAIDPWGAVLADGGTAPGVTLVEIDRATVAGVRQKLPSLSGDRAYAAPS
jgi:predicted amidohydrolase